MNAKEMGTVLLLAFGSVFLKMYTLVIYVETMSVGFCLYISAIIYGCL